MSERLENIYRERVDFSKMKTAFPMPDLLAIQRQSYADFLQMDLLPEERNDCKLRLKIAFLFLISKKQLNWILSVILSATGNVNVAV